MNKPLYDTLTDKERFFADQLFEIQRLLRALTTEMEGVDITMVPPQIVVPKKYEN